VRWWRRTVTLMIGVATALTLAAPGSAGVGPDRAATRTMAAVSQGGQATLAALPADFRQVMGYEPELATLTDGTVRAVNPQGSCSVPGEGRPFDFAVACQAHDFGYDLLRYAQRRHGPLASAARAEIDRTLVRDLRVECSAEAGPATCDATVAVFAAGVGFNSWRQVSGPPVDQSGLVRTAGLVLLVAFGSAGLVSVARRPGARPAARAHPAWSARPAARWARSVTAALPRVSEPPESPAAPAR
jgi:hypothetical protein